MSKRIKAEINYLSCSWTEEKIPYTVLISEKGLYCELDIKSVYELWAKVVKKEDSIFEVVNDIYVTKKLWYISKSKCKEIEKALIPVMKEFHKVNWNEYHRADLENKKLENEKMNKILEIKGKGQKVLLILDYFFTHYKYKLEVTSKRLSKVIELFFGETPTFVPNMFLYGIRNKFFETVLFKNHPDDIAYLDKSYFSTSKSNNACLYYGLNKQIRKELVGELSDEDKKKIEAIIQILSKIKNEDLDNLVKLNPAINAFKDLSRFLV